MYKIYVTLNRKLGNTDQRYEMIIPVKNIDGSYSTPKPLHNYKTGWAIDITLRQGKTVLVYPNGSYNTLNDTDQIITMFQE